jgi:hypothetical protein
MNHLQERRLRRNLWKLLKVSLVVVLGFGLFIFIGSEW